MAKNFINRIKSNTKLTVFVVLFAIVGASLYIISNAAGTPLSVKSYGALGNGSTDDTAAILSTFSAAAAEGKGVTFPAGTYRVSKELRIPDNLRDIELQTGSVIRQHGDAHVLRKVGSVASTTYNVTSGNNKGSKSLTLSTVSGLEVGSWLMLRSDDQMHFSKDMWRGSMRRITAISGNNVTIDSPLVKDLATNPRGFKSTLAKSVNIHGAGAVEFNDPKAFKFRYIVLLDYVQDPVISNVEVRRGGSAGIVYQNTVGGSINNVFIHDLEDNIYNNNYGYGVEMQGGARDVNVSGRVMRVRHAFTTGNAAGNISKGAGGAGDPENIKVTLDVSDTTSSGIDTHEPGYNIEFINCKVRNAGTYKKAGSTEGKYGGHGMEIRSSKTNIINSTIDDVAEAGVYILRRGDYTNHLPHWGMDEAPVIDGVKITGGKTTNSVVFDQPAVFKNFAIDTGNSVGLHIKAGVNGTVISDGTVRLAKSSNYVLDYGTNTSVQRVQTGVGPSTPTPTDTTKPTVSITSPSSGQNISGSVKIAASASDNVGVSRVEFRINGVTKATDSSAPYEYSWDTKTAANGSNTVTAHAFDSAGNTASNSVSVSVNNITPEEPVGKPDLIVSAVSYSPNPIRPGDAVGFSASIKNQGSAATPSGVPITVHFQIDGKDVTWTNGSSESLKAGETRVISADTGVNGNSKWSATEGNVNVVAIVDKLNTIPEITGDNNTVAVPISIQGDTQAPSISISSPTKDQTVSGSVTLVAQASDNKEVKSVEFRVGDKLVATDSQSPYTTPWDSKTVSNGTQVLSATARDAGGNARSVSLNFKVDNPVADKQPPSTPAGLKGTATVTSVSLSWSVSTDNVGVTKYGVKRNGTLYAYTTKNAYTDNNAKADTNYEYSVYALDAAGNASGESNLLVMRTNQQNDSTRPTTPALSLAEVTPTSARLRWTDSSDASGIKVYYVYRDSKVVAEVNRTELTQFSLYPNSKYVYYVRALDNAGNLSLSTPFLVVKTPALPTQDNVAPSQPTNLIVTGSPDRLQANLFWQASTDNAGVMEYRIYRNGRLFARTRSTSFGDTQLVKNEEYRYYVVAVDTSGNYSKISETVSIRRTGEEYKINIGGK